MVSRSDLGRSDTFGMARKYLILSFLCLLSPQPGFGFTETELDSIEPVEDSSPWRTDISFSLKRNLEVETRLDQAVSAREKIKPVRDSLFDPNSLYYGFDLRLNYSLKGAERLFSRMGSKDSSVKNILNKTNLFLTSSFNSSFRGYGARFADHDLQQYIHYALGDFVAGSQTQFYKSDKLLSYFDLSVVLYPLSRFSKEAGLLTTLGGTIRLLRFLKREENWNLDFSSSHNFAYSQYTKASADTKGYKKNIPWDTSNSFSFIYGQSYNKLAPYRTRAFVTHYFGIDTTYSHTHYLTFGGSFSWKIKQQFYVTFIANWRDRVALYNLSDKKIWKREKVRWDLSRTFFTLSASYSF